MIRVENPVLRYYITVSLREPHHVVYERLEVALRECVVIHQTSFTHPFILRASASAIPLYLKAISLLLPLSVENVSIEDQSKCIDQVTEPVSSLIILNSSIEMGDLG